MSDKQDSGDEIQTISHKFRSVTTIEPVFDVEQPRTTKMDISSTSCDLNESIGSSTDEHPIAVRRLPELNLPEKILFVIDTVRERYFTPFKLGTGAKYSPLFMIKRVIENFVSAKSTIQRAHEYALMSLDNEGAHWVCDFTNNTNSIVNCLDTIVDQLGEEDAKGFNLGQVFEMARSRLPLPPKTQPGEPATFVTRIILIYARSNSIPKIHTGQKSLEMLVENPYFFLDALFVHEVPCSEHTCEEVYAEVTALDTTGFSYILEVGRNAAKLHNSMAKLLAHPLQRPPQKDTSYSICNPLALHEVHTNV